MLVDPLLKSSERFQVNMPINARVKAVQTFKFFYTLLLQPCCPPAYVYNITEISTTSLAINFVFIGSNNFKFSTDINLMVLYRPYQTLGHIDFNLHYHVFDDNICKPPILK